MTGVPERRVRLRKSRGEELMADYREGRGSDRWQDRGGEQERMRHRDYRSGGWSGEHGSSYRGGRGRDDDRGFFDRAADEVRSWFSDDDDRGGGDRQRWERGQGQGQGSSRWQRDDMHEGRGWSNESSGGAMMGGRQERHRGGGMSDERGGRSGGMWGDRSSGGSYSAWDEGVGGYGRSEGSSGPQDTWGGSGYGGSEFGGRRFDRADVGSTGTHGAHPMSAPYGAGGGMYGNAGGGYRSSARAAAIYNASRGGGQHDHDPHYSEWRNRQIQELDRDYDEYRREHQSKFEQEFGTWRSKRQTQRQSLGRVNEHMEVVGSDGQHIGTVDKVRGDRIILTKSDPEAGGRHHSIPCSWIENVDERITVSKSAEEAKRAWQDEERNSAMFERDDQGSEGPHALNRSFSGTY